MNKDEFHVTTILSVEKKHKLERWPISVPSIDIECYFDLAFFSWGAYFGYHKIE